MNQKLVESLVQIIESLNSEEKKLLEDKLKDFLKDQGTSVDEIATPKERAKAYREWAESHPIDSPILSDKAISRETIYGERG
ncbi:MAG: hypothetical protein WBM32_18245 [Crocosphaera sp.]